MHTRVHEFSWPDRVIIGTVGMPGARTFYLQVREGKQLVSVALEKQQSALLAEKIDEILEQLITVQNNRFSVPTSTPLELIDNDPLEVVREQFRTGTMTLGWDPSTAQIIIEAHSISEDVSDENKEALDVDSADNPQMMRVLMPVGTARAFAERTREVVGAGRPMCPLCGYPVDANGHTCTIPEDY